MTILQAYRFASVIIIIGLYFCSSLFYECLFFFLPQRQQMNGTILHWFCRVLLKRLRFIVELEGHGIEEIMQTNGALILPNHISYLDIVAIQSLLPCQFVTSNDIGRTAFLGHLCRRGGCIFINRKSRVDLQRNIDEITTQLNLGGRLVLFPEGTTSPGDRILPYKSSLLEAALRSRTKVFPLCIQYIEIDGHPMTPAHNDRVAWYGDMPFFPHLWKLMTVRSLRIRITFPGSISFRHHRSRKLLTQEIQEKTTHLLNQ